MKDIDSEIRDLEEQYQKLMDEDAKTPGKHALGLNALGEELGTLKVERHRRDPNPFQ